LGGVSRTCISGFGVTDLYSLYRKENSTVIEVKVMEEKTMFVWQHWHEQNGEQTSVVPEQS
jgi:hypothetical protein